MPKKQKTFRLVQRWPFSEDLTETEGRVIEALRDGIRAETDAAFAGELEATRDLAQMLGNIRDGKGCDHELTKKEARAVLRVFKIWRRRAKEEEARLRQQAREADAKSAPATT